MSELKSVETYLMVCWSIQVKAFSEAVRNEDVSKNSAFYSYQLSPDNHSALRQHQFFLVQVFNRNWSFGDTTDWTSFMPCWSDLPVQLYDRFLSESNKNEPLVEYWSWCLNFFMASFFSIASFYLRLSPWCGNQIYCMWSHIVAFSYTCFDCCWD